MTNTFNQQEANAHEVTEIDHGNKILAQISLLYLDDAFSDVTLKVNEHTFQAHRIILAARSDYFRALLYGGFKESHSNEIILLPGTPIEAFRHFLHYVYTGKVSMANQSTNQIPHMYFFFK